MLRRSVFLCLPETGGPPVLRRRQTRQSGEASPHSRTDRTDPHAWLPPPPTASPSRPRGARAPSSLRPVLRRANKERARSLADFFSAGTPGYRRTFGMVGSAPPGEPSDRSLLFRLRAGSEDAAVQLYARY